jgi:hypothetical protein
MVFSDSAVCWMPVIWQVCAGLVVVVVLVVSVGVVVVALGVLADLLQRVMVSIKTAAKSVRAARLIIFMVKRFVDANLYNPERRFKPYSMNDGSTRRRGI